jgi:hypothetical protein
MSNCARTNNQETNMNIRIIFDTSSNNPDFNGDCDYAVVELTPESVDRIRRRVELARQAGRQDSDLWELYFWDCAADYYDGKLADACQEAVAAASGAQGDQAAQEWLSGLERDGYAIMPAAVDLSAHQPQRIECAQMIVRASPSSVNPQYEIAWTAIPKHTDVYVTTRDLPLAAMEGFVGGKPNKQ